MKKSNYGKLVVGVSFTLLCTWGSYQVIENFPKENVDNINEIIHNNNYKIEDFSRFNINEPYYEIIEEAKKRKSIADQKARIDKLRAERQAQLEKERLARLKQKEEEKKKVTVSRGQADEYASDWMTFEGSYYTAKCKGCSGITKSGYDVRNTVTYNGYHIIATDLSVIPLFSLVEVVTPLESFKAIVLDTGSAIKNKKVDILVSSYDEAIQKGRHDVKIRVIKYGN